VRSSLWSRASLTLAWRTGPHIQAVSHRLRTIALIQALCAEEGTRQPSPNAWLKEQDRKKTKASRNRMIPGGRLSGMPNRLPLAML
jgi:hypothetical protein